jgi:hypothetical protein
MAGKSFADRVREAAKDGGAERIISRINKIKDKAKHADVDSDKPSIISPSSISKIEFPTDQKNKQQDNRATEQANNRTSEQQDNRAIEQQNKRASGQMPEQQNKTTEQLPEQQDNRSTEQAHNRTGGQQDNRASEQEHNRTSEQQDNRASTQQNKYATEQQRPFNPELKPKDLKLNQYRILYEIYFNRPFKVNGPDRIGKHDDFPIPYGTVRNCLKSLYKKGYIAKPFSINDGIKKGTTCQVNESKCVPLFGSSNIVNSEQVDNRTIEQQNKWTIGQVGNRASGQQGNQTSGQSNKWTREQTSASYKSVSKFYKKLTDYIENSQFWKNQGVSVKKCESWLAEFYPDDPEALLSQLMFAEYADEHNSALQPKNKNKTPVDVFYGCLKKGGMTRPADFEFPDERAARIRREELENQKKILTEQAAIREQEKAMADEMAFIEFLKDTDSVSEMIEGMEQKKRFVTPKQKISVKLFRETGKIDSKLEHALRIEFNRDEE